MATTTVPVTTPATGDVVLRRVLLVDAVVTGANGLAYLAAAGVVGDLLDVSPTVLRPVGAFLVAFAAVVAWVATRPGIPTGAVRELVAGNVLWVVASLVVAATNVLDANGWGTAWIVAQAAVVAGFVAAQTWSLRRRG